MSGPNLAAEARADSGPLLAVRDLSTSFSTAAGEARAVRDVSFDVSRGETLGIVGESGSGKTVTLLSVMGLLPGPPLTNTTGDVNFDGENLRVVPQRRLRAIRGNTISMVFQDPATSLNPVLTIAHQLAEPLRLHAGMTRRQARARALELLQLVNIPAPSRRLDQFPHQISGGMRQRVMIAMALACEPKLLVADEPTTALDVTVQAGIVELVKGLRREIGMAIIWVTHDLSLLAGLADRVAVMYAGRIVEEAKVDDLYANPRHPYSIGLLESIPLSGAERRTPLRSIEGNPPRLTSELAACAFAPRCPYALDQCRIQRPELLTVGDAHEAACWVLPEKTPS